VHVIVVTISRESTNGIWVMFHVSQRIPISVTFTREATRFFQIEPPRRKERKENKRKLGALGVFAVKNSQLVVQMPSPIPEPFPPPQRPYGREPASCLEKPV